MGLYCAYSFDDFRITIVSLVLIIVGLVCLIIFFILRSFPNKALKRRWLAFYLNYIGYLQKKEENPHQSFDYKEMLDGISKNYYSDTDKYKNRIEKANVNNAKYFYDYSVLNNGEINYGYLVMANDNLFKRSRMINATLPAVFVYSTDEYYKENPKELKAIVDWAYEDGLNGLLSDNRKNFFNVKVCSEQTGGREVYFTCLLVCRRQLPLGYFMNGLLPVIANPEKSSSAFVVDCKYWTNDFANSYFDKEEEKDSYGDPFDI